MSKSFAFCAGGILSADIAVPEHEREVGFYSRVLTTGESPLWREDLMNNIGAPIIGLGARTEEMAQLPLQWMPHIQVADVAASAARALELGGSELMHGKDDAGASQWAVLRDPAGVAFGIIPVVPPSAAPPPSHEASVGRIAWLDLTVPDAATLRDFYAEVVGWTVQEVEMKDGEEPYADFAMLDAEGDAAAGICHARGTNSELPAAWLLYLPVGDFTESLRRVEAEGGKILKATQGDAGGHTYAVVEDPVGVPFTIMPG